MWVCGKSFTINGKQIMHNRRRTGDKPCKYKICEKSVNQILIRLNIVGHTQQRNHMNVMFVLSFIQITTKHKLIHANNKLLCAAFQSRHLLITEGKKMLSDAHK